MPIEIRELVIRATISDGEPNQEDGAFPEAKDKNVTIAACVEQVLAILREQTER